MMIAIRLRNSSKRRSVLLSASLGADAGTDTGSTGVLIGACLPAEKEQQEALRLLGQLSTTSSQQI